MAHRAGSATAAVVHAVGEELHFGNAALRLGLSQPQVSRHVANLEHARGVEVGSHAELMTRGGTYAELFSLQAAAYA
ncbi:MAG TPA: LysR family transcriptional regulator [Solirubrobacteraceae bacterium]|nr:LysR family transcriptional regulator [Solirubrobacteraceae bacterium]